MMEFFHFIAVPIVPIDQQKKIVQQQKEQFCEKLIKLPVQIDNLTWISSYITPDLQYIRDKEYATADACIKDCAHHNFLNNYSSQELFYVGLMFDQHRKSYLSICN